MCTRDRFSMINSLIIIPTKRAASFSFWYVCTLLVVYIVRVLNILLVRKYFQVAYVVIGSIKVFVINLQPTFNLSVERLPNHAVNALARVFGVFTKARHKIMLQKLRFYYAIRLIARPCISFFDGMRGCYTCTQKLSNLLQCCSRSKHTFSLWYFGCINQLCSRHSTHVSCVTNFVQPLKINHWFPCFHLLTPFNINRSIA